MLAFAEIRLVLLDRLAFVVQDGLTAGNAAQRVIIQRGIRFRLGFLQQYITAAVGVLDSDLKLYCTCGKRLFDKLLTQDRAGTVWMMTERYLTVIFHVFSKCVDKTSGRFI